MIRTLSRTIIFMMKDLKRLILIIVKIKLSKVPVPPKGKKKKNLEVVIRIQK